MPLIICSFAEKGGRGAKRKSQLILFEWNGYCSFFDGDEARGAVRVTEGRKRGLFTDDYCGCNSIPRMSEHLQMLDCLCFEDESN